MKFQPGRIVMRGAVEGQKGQVGDQWEQLSQLRFYDEKVHLVGSVSGGTICVSLLNLFPISIYWFLFIAAKASTIKEENGKRDTAELEPSADTCWQRSSKIIER